MPTIAFPDLTICLAAMVRTLVHNDVSEFRHIDYPAAIKEYGSAEELLRDAAKEIEPEVLDMQGKKIITPQL